MRSEAVSEQEMAEISRTPSLLRSGYASVNSRDDTLSDNSHDTNVVGLKDYSAPSQVKLRDFMRQFRLQFASSTLSRCMGSRWNSDTERRKVAIHRNRAVAATHGLLHVVPLSGAIILLIFQWTNYWVDERNDYSTELQFVAKLHELLMQASIVEVLIGLIRAGLINGLVPFGALSGAMQPTQLSYLWSLDFFSIFQSRAFQGWRKTVFVIVIPLLIALTALVGPSSAVLMIPRAGVPRTVSNSVLWGVASDEASYPSQIPITSFDSDIQGLNLTLRYSDEYESGRSRGSNTISYLGDTIRSFKRLLQWSSNSLSVSLFRPGSTDMLEVNVTIPTEVMTSESLGLPSGNTTVTVVAAHPVVGAQCWGSTYRLDNSSDWYYPYQWTSLMPDLPTLISKVSDTVELSTDKYGETDVFFSPVWISLPEPADHPLLVLFFQGRTNETWNQTTLVEPGLLLSMIESKDPAVIVSARACAISAYWNFGEVQKLKNGKSILVATAPLSSMEQSTHRKITLDIAGDHPMQSAKFYSLLMELLGAPYLGGFGLEGIISAALAVWIAQVPNLASIKTPNGLYPYDFFSYQPPDKNMEDYTPYKFVTTKYGYGYGIRSTSVYLSMTVLVLYCAVTIGYMLYTFATGLASTAWNSGVELLALALQSKRPDHLGYVGVGIDSAKTLSESVGIRVNADNQVELVFAHDRDFSTRGLQKVKENKEY